MHIKYLTRILLTILVYNSFVSAQQYQLQFKNLNHKQGLSDSRISDVLQTSDGIIWIGGQIAVDRFDGENTTPYDLGINNTINQLLEDNSDHVWAATLNGLFVFNKSENSFKKISEYLIKNNQIVNQNITSIVQAEDNWIYFSTKKGIIARFLYDPENYIIENSFETLKTPNGFVGHVTKISKAKDHSFWLGTNTGSIYKLKDDSISLAFSETEYDIKAINDLCEDYKNNLWIGSNIQGLIRINLSDKNITYYNNAAQTNKSINNNIVLSLLPSKDHLWIGTDGGGLNLYEYETDSFSYFIQDNSSKSISDNSILSVKKGLNDNILLGTVHGGVSIFKSEFAIKNIPPETLGFTHVDQQGSIILEDSNNNLWISAGRNGLLRYTPRTKTSKTYTEQTNNKPGLNGNIVLSLFEDKKHRLWIGTFRGGLNILDLNSDEFITDYDTKKFNSVWNIKEDGYGNIWVGNRVGITIYDSDLNIVKELSPVSQTNILANSTKAIFKDINNDMWVGTINGLFKYDYDTKYTKKHKYIHDKTNANTISNNHILSIGQCNDLSILVGTHGHGVNKYNRTHNNFERLDELNGKASVTQGIFPDELNNIWLSTLSGLVKIDSSGTATSFEENDGVYPFTGGAAITDHKGQILMAGNYGLSYFSPKDLNPTPTNFKINFTSAHLINRDSIHELSSTHLAEYQNNKNKILEIDPENIMFNIKYACADPIINEEINYAYKIKELDNYWHSIGEQQSISFSNLKPGKYTLALRGANKNGKWGQHTIFLNIKVLPTLWESLWFKIVIIIFAMVLIYFIITWRISSINKQKENLSILLNQRAEEVKQQQNKIAENKIKILEIEKEHQELQQKKLEGELAFKTKELTNNTLRTVHKNDLLNDIKENLKKEVRHKDINKDNLKKLISHIDDSFMLDKEWDHFYSLFNQIHPSFIENLKTYNPQLNEREIKLCALILMEFTSQNMATLFGISLSSVKVARHRLRKKLELNENESILDFLKKLQ
ncbi:two-component regulator propeller domain-containing protein [Aestuariibaculum sediminum]|uniref:Two component regulator three Y domain-containing protein n=1 Tax=Aestuariibaculum sediminum TaxID=2770637 RepID=A0A8J6Q331_9FLAO|nr:two-component regulator propeller domain-containing protein [Aestuariibaculum sediminum]MBD0832999.1 hypothetical protein [Aestuariibaculum sediminum]